MTSAYEYRANLARNNLPGPADCITTRQGQFVCRRFPYVEGAAIADTHVRRGADYAERTLRAHRRMMAELSNG